MPRIKSTAPALTREQVADIVGVITVADNTRAKLVAEMNAEIDAVRARYSDQIEGLDIEIGDKTASLESWARANQDAFGSARSMEFARGTIGFRLGMWQVKPTKGNTLKTILEALKRTTWGQAYIRTKEELDRENLVAMRGELTADQAARAGFTFVQEDRFFVEPKQDVATASVSEASAR